MADIDDLASGAKFYEICAKGLQYAQQGAYGPDFSVEDLRKNLREQAVGYDGSFNSWPFGMVSRTVEQMDEDINLACTKYTQWIDAGRPARPVK